MTAQQTNQPQRRIQHREDYKVQKLVQRIEELLSQQARAIREASQTSAKN